MLSNASALQLLLRRCDARFTRIDVDAADLARFLCHGRLGECFLRVATCVLGVGQLRNGKGKGALQLGK